MIGRIREPDLRERNNKSQTPSSREIPNFKFQNLSQARCLGAWDLELLWCLVFGALIGGRPFNVAMGATSQHFRAMKSPARTVPCAWKTVAATVLLILNLGLCVF